MQAVDVNRLATHRRNALSRYKDYDAGYSILHEVVFNVECPSCHLRSGSLNAADPSTFKVQRPIEAIHSEGFDWTVAACSKCDFRFRVIVHADRFRTR